MNRRMRVLLALVLVLALLAGCTGSLGQHAQSRIQTLETKLPLAPQTADNSWLVYTRPDLQELEGLLETLQTASREQSLEELADVIFSIYDAYDWFYTHYALADIRYCADITDTGWEEEYRFCMENAPRADAVLEQMYYILAVSPMRHQLEEEFFGEGFFDDYDGENLWEAGFQQLLEEENALINRYYTLSEDALAYEPGSTELYDNCGSHMMELLVELIRIRQQIAAYWGYESYPEFAWDFYYTRDFTPEQAMSCYDSIRVSMAPLYRATVDSQVWNALYEPTDQESTMAYVRETAHNLGGTVGQAWDTLERRGLFDSAYGENKYTASFEYYLTGYGVPFVFLSPEEQAYDWLTFAHEFGHFCCDYAARGSICGIDVGEVFSQGMEYLSLCYAPEGESLVEAKLADSLFIYVEQAAFGTFEQRMYDLEGEKLSPEGLMELYSRIAEDFGFDSLGYDSREFVEINHFYTNPLYVVSYVLSNDAALQLYLLEQEQPGSGAQLLQSSLATEESCFLAFLEQTGLESPFAIGRMDHVAAFLESVLLS